MNDSHNLKPCPSCESKDLKHFYVYVKCLTCGMRGPETNGGRNDEHADYIDRKRAQELWNALPRPQSQAKDAQGKCKKCGGDGIEDSDISYQCRVCKGTGQSQAKEAQGKCERCKDADLENWLSFDTGYSLGQKGMPRDKANEWFSNATETKIPPVWTKEELERASKKASEMGEFCKGTGQSDPTPAGDSEPKGDLVPYGYLANLREWWDELRGNLLDAGVCQFCGADNDHKENECHHLVDVIQMEKLLPSPPVIEPSKEKGEDGFWRSCSGCYVTLDGQNVDGYPFDDKKGCHLGAGCDECDNVGATFEPIVIEPSIEKMAGFDGPKGTNNKSDPPSSEAGKVDEIIDSECLTCGEEDAKKDECSKSKRTCGHHSNSSWTHDECNWCGKVFGEIGFIVDISEMPNYNPKVPNGANSVSEGKVFWTDKNKVTCKEHGACLCVSPDRKIWRCATCNEGAYLPTPPDTKQGKGE